MKKFLLFSAVIFSLISCKSTTQVVVNEDITKLKLQNGIFYTLKDNQGERTQPNSRFYGENDQEKVDKLSPSGQVASSIHSFLLEKNGKKAIFDTGFGEKGKLWQHLNELKINELEIDYIFLTHLHGDHIGGLLKNGEKVFPKAKIFVSEAEYNYWIEKTDNLAYKVLKIYENQLEKFDYSKNLPLKVKPIEAHGHTPGHCVFEVENLLIIGDIFHGIELQLQDLSICPSYDIDKEKAIISRKKIVDYAQKNKKIMAGMHLPKNGIWIFK